jgi:hypothetical protein
VLTRARGLKRPKRRSRNGANGHDNSPPATALAFVAWALGDSSDELAPADVGDLSLGPVVPLQDSVVVRLHARSSWSDDW